jgi:short-subunit dehydrogenase
MLDLNCRAPVLLAHTFIPKLLKRGQGGFLMTGSLEGFLGFPESSSYSATKSFIHSFGEGLWGELKNKNIDILVLAPGSTDTESLSHQNINRDRLTHIMHPRKVAELALKRLGKGPVYIPGILNRILMRFLLLLPRKLAIMAVGKGIKMSRY